MKETADLSQLNTAQSDDTSNSFLSDLQSDRKTTGLQSIKAATELGFEGNMTMRSLDREMPAVTGAPQMFEPKPTDEPKLSVEALNKKYPGLPVPFTEPTPDSVATAISERQAHKQKLEEIVANGPQGWAYKTARFAAGAVAGALDPMGLGLMELASPVAGAAMAKGGLGKVLAIGAEKSTMLQTFGRGAVEGTVANLAATPVQKDLARSEHENFSWANELTSAVVGGAFFGGLHVVGSMFSPKQVKMMENVAVGQASMGKVPNLAPLEKDFTMEKTGSVSPDFKPATEYQFKPFDTSDKMYGPEINQKSIPIGGKFGDGTYVTDNPAVANGHAAPKINDVPGQINQVNLENSNLKDIGLNPTREMVDAARSEGVDGVHYQVDSTNGMKHEPFNAALVFDNEKVNSEGSFDANGDAVHRATNEEIQRLAEENMSPKSDFGYDAKAHEDFQKLYDEPLKEMEKYQDIQKIADQNDAEIREQYSGNPEHADFKQYKELIEDMKAKVNDNETLIKGAKNCLTRSG